jgi:glycosyltransferase involved in cell wall biosynthesis
VEFTGTVADMRPYLASATVVVVPLRLGSGTRLKIIEAGAAGKAIVSTHLGAEGLELDPGKEIILADEPAEIATQVIKLLRDARARQMLGRSARARVAALYSQDVVKQAVAEALSSVHAAGVFAEQEASQ